MKEYQKIKIFLQKVTLQIGLKKFLWLEKLKILFCGHLLLVILMMKKLLERFMKRNCKKTNQREKWNLEWKKLLKKAINYTSNGKFMIILLIVGLIKKI